MTSFWAAGLIRNINDKSNHLIASDAAIVIQDKYPKAKHHYLVLPRENLNTIYDLDSSHLPLLEEMHLLALNIVEIKGQELDNFKFGFHAEPSMERLHLHVVSQDFVSDCLKTKKHWNTFTTQYFRPYEDVYNELKTCGEVKRYEKDFLGKLLAQHLKCNQCEVVAKNMPELKSHLLHHYTYNKNVNK